LSFHKNRKYLSKVSIYFYCKLYGGKNVKKIFLSLVLLCIVAGILASGCVEKKAPAPEKKVEEKPLIIGTTDKITVLDPAKSYDFYTWEVFNNIGEGLLRYKPGTTDIEPGLAESYTVSEDGLVYTFKLRKGLKFTDGTPFNASVVKWSIERVLRLNADPSWLVESFIDSVNVVHEYTVQIKLKKPVSYFPALLALDPPYYPVSPKAYPANEIKDSTVGIGPYKVVKWVRDQELILEANPDYYGEKPKTKKVVIKFYKDAATMRLALEKGEIDVAWRTLSPVDIKDLEEKGKFNVIGVPGGYIRYIVINVETPPLSNKTLRQAIAYAVDRKAIADKVFYGTVEPLYSMVPIGMWSHIDAFKEKYGERDLEKAKELLRQCGYSEDNPLELEFWYTPTHYGDTEKDVAAVIKESLEETGMIKVTLKSAEWATYAAEYIAKGTMPIFLLGWYPDYIDPDNYLTPFLHSEYSADLGSRYKNPEMDKLLEEAQIKLSKEERTKLYEDAQRLLAEDVPLIPLFQGKLYIITQTNVKGVTLDPTMMLRYYLIYKE